MGVAPFLQATQAVEGIRPVHLASELVAIVDHNFFIGASALNLALCMEVLYHPERVQRLVLVAVGLGLLAEHLII